MNDVAEETRQRRALLHMLEDLQRERDAASEARRQWLDTVDAVSHPLMVHDTELRVVRANRAYADAAGMELRDIIGRPYWECFPRQQGALEAEEFTLDSGRVFVTKSFAIRGDVGGHSLRLFEDITEKKAADTEIRTLNTLYATLSAVNHAIVLSKTRHELCERMVRAVTDNGIWKGAWIGFVEPDSTWVKPDAW